jgi:hypothetical protein
MGTELHRPTKTEWKKCDIEFILVVFPSKSVSVLQQFSSQDITLFHLLTAISKQSYRWIKKKQTIRTAESNSQSVLLPVWQQIFQTKQRHENEISNKFFFST